MNLEKIMEKMRKLSKKEDFPKGKIRSNGFYTLLANVFIYPLRLLNPFNYLHRDNFWFVMSHLGFVLAIILFVSLKTQISHLENQNRTLNLENQILIQKERMFYINQVNQNR